MSASLYEIVELDNGDVALQRVDEDGEPLLCIRFSTESLSLMRDGKFDIAKAMIEAGMEAAGDLADADDDEAPVAPPEDERLQQEGQTELYNKRTLH